MGMSSQVKFYTFLIGCTHSYSLACEFELKVEAKLLATELLCVWSKAGRKEGMSNNHKQMSGEEDYN
jgi:hypothetical protein